MVETHWDDLRERTLRYRDATWRLTGDVEVERDGALLGVEAEQDDDVRRRTATLYFGIDGTPETLNPGNLGANFDRIERIDGRNYLVVDTEGRTYRYELHRMEYE